MIRSHQIKTFAAASHVANDPKKPSFSVILHPTLLFFNSSQVAARIPHRCYIRKKHRWGSILRISTLWKREIVKKLDVICYNQLWCRCQHVLKTCLAAGRKLHIDFRACATSNNPLQPSHKWRSRLRKMLCSAILTRIQEQFCWLDYKPRWLMCAACLILLK